MCTLSVSNVIYHKFSHGAAFYTLNGKNVNVTLELKLHRRRHNVVEMVFACWIERTKKKKNIFRPVPYCDEGY